MKIWIELVEGPWMFERAVCGGGFDFDLQFSKS